MPSLVKSLCFKLNKNSCCSRIIFRPGKVLLEDRIFTTTTNKVVNRRVAEELKVNTIVFVLLNFVTLLRPKTKGGGDI